MSIDSDIVTDEEYAAQEIERATLIDAGFTVIREARDKSSALYIMIEAARADAIAANKALIVADANDAARIRELQWKISRFYDLQRYIAEVVENGRNAFDTLTDTVKAEWAKMLGDGDQQEKDV